MRELANKDWSGLASVSLGRLATRGAANSADALERRLWHDFGHSTFADAFELSGKRLVVCVSNAKTKRPEFWDHLTHPHTPLRQAVRASVSVPFVFPPAVVDGGRYVDGNVLCPRSPVPRDLPPADDGDTVFIGTESKCPAWVRALVRRAEKQPRPQDDPRFDAVCVVDTEVPLRKTLSVSHADVARIMAAGVDCGKRAFERYARPACARTAR